uniref:Uncharacterized protein n=1 Tax=Cajanus cajan TaxID=3821 RepID=A0A151UEG6_CAJCA
MMIYERLYSIFVIDVKSVLLVQEAQLEKYCQEFTSPSVFVNVVQGPQVNYRGFQFSNRGGCYHGRGCNRDGG